MTFANPTNGYTEKVNHPFLWTLIFGSFYFALKGVWRHFVISLLLASATLCISWLIYPFFAKNILRSHYLRLGWREVTSGRLPPSLTPRDE